jgi:hypothetical protein
LTVGAGRVVLEQGDGPANQRDGQRQPAPEADPRVADVAEQPQDVAEDGPAADRHEQLEVFLVVLADGEGAEGQAEEHAGVNERRVLQQEEQQEGQQPAAHAVALAQLADRGDAQEQGQAAKGAQGDVAQLRPPLPLVELQADVEEQAEVNAFEDEFRLLPAHDACGSVVYFSPSPGERRRRAAEADGQKAVVRVLVGSPAFRRPGAKTA